MEHLHMLEVLLKWGSEKQIVNWVNLMRYGVLLVVIMHFTHYY
jgi:hypothetical protein